MSWPGNYCLDCGLDDPNESEDALIDCPYSKFHDWAQSMGYEQLHELCDVCSGTGCVPNPNLVVAPCIWKPDASI